MPIIPYHTALELVATAITVAFTQPCHTTTQGLQLSLEMDRQALPHASHATSQPYSSMLSLSYPYAMPMVYPYPMPMPMVVPQPCTHHSHSAHRATERATETHKRSTQA